MKLSELKKEMPYKWRVQSANKWGAACVAYVDSRDVQDLLDEVIGADKWQVKYSTNKNNLFASIGIKIGDEWVWKSDCGVESNVEKQKGEASDSFKRAAVMWGVGRFLYSLPIQRLPVKEKSGRYVPYSEKQNKFVTNGDVISSWCTQLLNSKK